MKHTMLYSTIQKDSMLGTCFQSQIRNAHQHYGHTYPSLLFEADISSFVDKVFHSEVMAFACCNVQGSSLIERNNLFKDVVAILAVRCDLNPKHILV